jgi:hypothetical protein
MGSRSPDDSFPPTSGLGVCGLVSSAPCRWRSAVGGHFRRDYPAVTDGPETRYTRSADGTNLAYQVSGAGPLELVFVHGGG